MATVRYSTIRVSIISIVVGLLTAREITRDNIVSVQGADNESIFRTRYNPAAASDNDSSIIIANSTSLNVTVEFDGTVFVSGIKVRLVTPITVESSITAVSLTSRYGTDCVTSYDDVTADHVDGGNSVILRRNALFGPKHSGTTTQTLYLPPATSVSVSFVLAFNAIRDITVNYIRLLYNIHIHIYIYM